MTRTEGHLSLGQRSGLPPASQGVCCLVLPSSSAEWAPLLLLGSEPLGDALQMEGVGADSPDHRAVVAWELAVRGTAIERHSADATDIIPCIPGPQGYCVPVVDLDLEGAASFGRRLWVCAGPCCCCCCCCSTSCAPAGRHHARVAVGGSCLPATQAPAGIPRLIASIWASGFIVGLVLTCSRKAGALESFAQQSHVPEPVRPSLDVL